MLAADAAFLGLAEGVWTMSAKFKSARFALGSAVLALLAGSAVHGAGGLPASGGARVDDFELSDQTFVARHLYKMADAKAVVLISYASGDRAFRADAPAYKALKAAYADKG